MPDYPKFCTSCGSPLEPGQKFCTSCGSSIKPEAADVSSGSDVSSSADRTIPIYKAGDTSPMPVVDKSGIGSTPFEGQSFSASDSVNRQYRQSAQSSSNAPSSSNSKKVLIAVVIALAVVVCVLVGVLFGVTSGADQSGSQQSSSTETTQSQSNETPSSDQSSNSAESSNSVSAADKELYNTLSGYYSRLGSYDSQISSVAKDFNANYMSKSINTRSSYSSSAISLQEEIADEYAALKNLNVPSSSRYSSCYSSILTCYYDCTQRIGAIVESWNNSLSYSDPTGHSDEICAPLSRDKVGSNNKYFTEFNQTYPSAKPASPNE